MTVRRSNLLVLTMLVCWSVAAPAWATVDNQKSYKQVYPEKAAATSCKTCHVGAIGKKGNLNAYGQALQQLKGPGKALKLTPDEIRSVPEASAAPAAEPHAQNEPQPSSHDAAVASTGEDTSAASELANPKAEYVGMETCAACHGDVAAKHKRSPHTKIGADGPGGLDISCESCHGAGSLHVNAGGGKGVGGIINPSKDPSTCFSCHTDKKMEFALQYHHPVPEGRMSCADCHAPHGEKPTPRAARAQNEQCMTCHQQVRGPWVFEHLAMRDGCTSCHQPHGSITTRLLTERDFNLCLKCHYSAVQYQALGHYAHRRAYNPAGVEGANCTGCHRAIHGSNFSKELRTQ